MVLFQLERAAWQPFFDRVSKGLAGKPVDLEVAALALGVQIEAKWSPLLGIVYDARNDLIEIVLDGLDHLIRCPQTVYVDEGPLGLANMHVIDGDGIKHLLRLREPLTLPPSRPTEQWSVSVSGMTGQRQSDYREVP